MESRAAPLTLITLLLAAAPSIAQRPRALQADVAASYIYVITHRTGLLSFLGHEHAIVASKWTAELCWDPVHAGSKASLVVDARALEIDSDSGRALARLGKGPSAQQRSQIERKLHDADHLASERNAEIRFESSAVSPNGSGMLRLRGRLTIKSRTQDVEMPVAYQARSDGSLWLAGSVKFRQSAFGIRPESIAGVVKVADVVDLHVGLLAKPAEQGC